MDRKGSDSTGWRPAGGQNQAGGCLTPDQTESRIRASHAALNSCRSLGEQLQPIDLYVNMFVYMLRAMAIPLFYCCHVPLLLVQ